ncbi:MBL fold metallo-hydrolase [Janthinobacterium fluminis]|uniref:MBL fold metallo-hydrolase n=1 Tax=Janthinobacterium fluminis TaxID=2987524 RepID=A0ABT5K3W3_9BURK|nr:MBL fold metallo-hydrolase [Janthinobacterium fluminis]MDC8759103.1 MBL fold metallo-hydrolase [Janthinobacterium fluminis]
MKVKFWGVRGSIPSPGPRTARYGGNTTCIEVRTDDGTLIVLDAGTGIYALAQSLPPGQPVQADIFITHSHWDHIHGLPFFTPLFVRGSRICLHGAHEQGSGNGIEHVLGVQLQNSYFPVSEAAMAARIDYRTLAVGEAIEVGGALVRNTEMNHPVTDLGYRIDCGGHSVFFSGDHEPHDERLPDAAAAQRQASLATLVRGVDALIMDCSYTREEYPAKRGWGHGSFDAAFALALDCGARRLYCTHHEPGRDDDELEAVFADVMARHAPLPAGMQAFLAYEGLEIAFP